MASQIINRYGKRWVDKFDLEIELYMIARGGRWTENGKTYGDGMFEHMMRARKLLWPNRYRHRWTDLIYKNVIENIVSVLMGPGSSGKTSHASEIALIRYFARPNDSLCLVSTTTVDKLEMAVFGELKMLYRAAKELHSWLPGNIIDSKKAITTDVLEDGETRDIRKGIVGKACFVGQRYVGLGHFAGIKQNQITFLADECFPDGTMVDTLCGPTRIESLRPKDIVLCASGESFVVGTRTRFTKQLVLVKCKDGRQFYCTPEHRVFTQQGWINACNLDVEHYMINSYEAMRILQEGVPNAEEAFLQRILRLEMGSQPTENKGVLLQSTEGGTQKKSTVVYCPGAAHGDEESHAQSCFVQESGDCYSRFRVPTTGSWGKWNWSFQGRASVNEDVPKRTLELPSEDWDEARERISAMLQSGFGVSEFEIGNRSGRVESQQSASESQRQKENRIFRGSWVESITFLKQGDIGFPNPSSDPRGCRVHNLHVAGHPSYSVNGFLVHNCQFMASTFFDCLPNMFQGCGLDGDNEPDIKVIPMGNPRHDPFDQLSISAEPVTGWESVKDIVKTTVWKTKFHRGVCVNLIGTDSPNFDVPEGVRPPYPRLISRQSCKLVESRWKPGTLQHNSQVVGKMIMGMLGNRVLTKTLCEEHHAFDKAVWRNNEITKLWFLDPAWGGDNADRCVWGWLEFGTEITGRQIMRFGEYIIVPIYGEGGSPDDQIAKFCKTQAIARGIPLAQGFYDSTGRGTVGAAFARIFGGEVPVPVAFGDRPSKRPVRHDLFVTDDVTHVRRHKRCDEEYGKYVTELWFAVRNVVECDQMRELPEDVMQEGCMREYGELPGGKIDVETKEEMKDRIGYSPDLFDALVVGVEGARQLGFRIDRLGYDILESDPKQDDFFDEEAKLYRDAIEAQLLKH